MAGYYHVIVFSSILVPTIPLKLRGNVHRQVWVYDGPAILLCLTAVAGLFVSYDPDLGIVTLFFYLVALLLYGIISRGGKQRIVSWHVAAWGLVILCAAVALVFILQAAPLYIIRRVDALSGLRYWVEGTERAPAPGVPALLLALVKTQPRMNSVATFLEGPLFLAIGLAFSNHSRKKQRAALAAAALMAAAVLLSKSLGAWLAVLAAGLVWLAFYWRPARYLLLAAGAALLALVFFVIARGDISALGQIPVVGSLLGSMFIRPDRLEVYHNSLLLIQDFPLSGIGFGRSFSFTYSRYTLLIPVEFLTNSHNLYLEIWLQQGLLGLAAFIALAVGILANARCQLESGDRRLFYATWVGLLAVLVHGVSDARQYDDPLCWVSFFWLLALNARLLLHDHECSAVNGRLAWIAPGAGALFLLAALLFRAQHAPLPAVYWANKGALLHQRADLDATLGEWEKEPLVERAWADYIKALAWHPANRTANHRLGLLALDAGDFPAAVKYLETAYAADPHHGGVSKALGLAYAFTGDLAAARPLLEGLPDIVPEMNYWGNTYLKGGAGEAGRPSPEMKAAGLHALKMSLQLNPGQAELKKFLEEQGE